MKQLTVISGKGGTGKTSITACFAALSENTVIADCDVDAADLHLILKPVIKKTRGFRGLKVAHVDRDKCIKCMKCYENCKFDAIDEDINIEKDACEGCAVCRLVCPTDAVQMMDRESGLAFISETRFGPLSHAVLKTAEEASGKLVTVVRNNAVKIAEEKQKKLIIIDGPPGIGCPVISAITGVDMVLIVTEPTLSAINDLKRVMGVTKHFSIPTLVCINKYDINLENSEQIERHCKENNVELVGKISYDEVFTNAMINEKTVVEFSDEETSEKIRKMWKKILYKFEE